MTENDIIEFLTGLPGVAAVTAGEHNGAPRVAWGDTFFYYDPDDMPANRKMPFATIVVKDYEGFDTASDLNRPGVFRLNIGVGRAVFEELLGYPPAAHADHHEAVDYRVLDRILPHPVYATQSWICVLNPGDATAARVRTLLTGAHARAAARHRQAAGA
ncbi:MAG: erythromycin esterase [Microbispora sp.]|nr:erythromycin esterase [Microbispora sp.]